MREIKFRAWYALESKWVTYGTSLHGTVDYLQLDKETEGEYTGMKGEDGVDIYTGDIGEFSNGDRFIVCIEDWMEIYIKWIGVPECEDQARDLYRIGRSLVIGNIHQNPELLEQV